jgi:hypothetical protein
MTTQQPAAMGGVVFRPGPMEIETMNLNLGGLLGLLWAKNKNDEDAAYSRLASIVADLDITFQDMQDVIIDHRDEAIVGLWPRMERLPIGSPEQAQEMRKALRPWARRDRPVLAGYEQHLRETRTLLPFMPGWEHIDPRLQVELPSRFDEVISVIGDWLALFDEATNGKGPAILARWIEANRAWTELSNLLDACGAMDDLRRRR